MLIKKVYFSFIPTLGVCANWTLKAVAVRKHLERNRKDKDSKFRLILIESRIHRLSRYYKTVGVLPPTWRYESATASTLVA
jgi:small subunit ribosomal protein S13e